MSSGKNKKISTSLAAATCALLGSVPNGAVNAQEEPKWDFNTAFLYYGEDADRVDDLSISLLASRRFADDRILSMGLTVDSLTGASPVGATPMDTVQTFTRPSGKKVFDVPANEYPLDDSFLDTRYAGNIAWEQPLGRFYEGGIGLSFSTEYDYTHAGVNLNLTRNFNKKNTAFSIGLALSQDDIDPVGGTPLPFTQMPNVGDLSNRVGDQSKDIVDVLIGVTQVINENFLLQVNYSYSDSSGYLTDPYKILSLVDPVTGDTLPYTPPPGEEGPSNIFLYENRPDSRTKNAFFVQGKYYLSGQVVDLSYRFMSDDWDITSHTIDARYRFPIGQRSYLEPHFRYYTQSEADFYQASLNSGVPLPVYASADYRLGEFSAITAGFKYGWKTQSGQDFNLRLEYYTQDGDVPKDQVIGNQANRDLYPGLNAIIFSFGYHFEL